MFLFKRGGGICCRGRIVKLIISCRNVRGFNSYSRGGGGAYILGLRRHFLG